MKGRLSAALLVTGLLLTGASTLVAYLARNVLDREAFTDRVVMSLDRPAVSAVVGQSIADAVIAANRDLTGIRPVVATFAEAVVGSAPFRALVRRAAREAHRGFLSPGAENLMLSVPDVGALLRGTLETVSPDIAERVPPDLRAVIQTRLTGALAGRVVAALQVAHRVRLFARLGVVAGILMIVGGVMLAPVRGQAVLNAAIGLLAVAAVVALTVPLGAAALSGAVRDPAMRPVVAELWSVFMGGLRSWAAGAAIVALLLIAAVASLLDRVVFHQVVRDGIGEIVTRQPTRGREAARVAVLLVVGAFAVSVPLGTLATAVVVFGAVVLVIAVHELVALLVRSDRPREGGAGGLRLNPALAVAVGCVVVTAGAQGAAALALRFRTPPPSVTADAALRCNGAPELCDRRLDDVTLAGAHNAMGASTNPHWMFPNQDGSVAELLGHGIRAFMLDVWYGSAIGDAVKTDFRSEDDRRKYEAAIGPEAFAAAMRIRDRMVGEGGSVGLYMCHGFCELGALPFDTALGQLRAFLAANPREVVLLILEDYVAPDDVEAAFEQADLLPYVYKGPVDGPLPTLGEMIAASQRLVVLGEHRTGDVPWYYPAFEVIQETPYTFHSPDDFACRLNRGEPGNPLFLMNHWIETTPAPLPSNAELVNTEQAIVSRARTCRRVRGKLPNVIAVDFAATGDVVGAVAVLNGLAIPGGDAVSPP